MEVLEASIHLPRITSSPSSLSRGIHLVILIHGFQGNSFDMKLLKNNLLLYKPELLIYCSNKNEDNTEGDIAEMGRRLAEEIQEYIRDFCPGSALGRLSFIGYSLGGIIARACFPHLGSLHSKFHTFITLSSPHISFLYSSSSLFDAGKPEFYYQACGFSKS